MLRFETAQGRCPISSKKITTQPAATAAKTGTSTAASAPAAKPTPAATPPPTAPPTTEPPAPPITGVANGSNAGTKLELQSAYLALIAGLLAFYQPDDVFALPMGDLTRDQVIAELQDFVNTAEATKSANQAWRQAVQAERATELSVRPVRASVKNVVVGRFGKGATQLLKFGFEPTKPVVRSTTSKSVAVAKGKATRVARGTAGKVQKKAIKGNVTGVIITPVTAGAPVPVTAPVAESNAASGTNGAVAPATPASPAVTGGTTPHS